MLDDSDPLDESEVLSKLADYEQRITRAEFSGDFLYAAQLAVEASALAVKHDLFRHGATFDERALQNLEALPTPLTVEHLALKVKCLNKSGMNYFHLGDIELASARLEEALRLADESVPARTQANLHWNAAVLAQRRHVLVDGLSHALSAWEYYSKSGPVSERLRLQVQIAQLALDLAESAFSQGSYPLFESYARLAEDHLKQAYARYHTWFPPNADAVLPLAWVRLSRLTHREENRFPLIEETLTRTSQNKDDIGHGQALISFADELACQGKTEAARDAYIRAYDFLAHSSAPGLALKPLGELLRGDEFGRW